MKDLTVFCVELIVDDAAFTPQPEPIGAIFAVALNREHRFNAIGLTQVEIILAMVRCHVDEARAAVSGDKIAREHWPGFREETAEFMHWVADHCSGKVGAFDGCYEFKLRRK